MHYGLHGTPFMPPPPPKPYPQEPNENRPLKSTKMEWCADTLGPLGPMSFFFIVYPFPWAQSRAQRSHYVDAAISLCSLHACCYCLHGCCYFLVLSTWTLLCLGTLYMDHVIS